MWGLGLMSKLQLYRGLRQRDWGKWVERGRETAERRRNKDGETSGEGGIRKRDNGEEAARCWRVTAVGGNDGGCPVTVFDSCSKKERAGEVRDRERKRGRVPIYPKCAGSNSVKLSVLESNLCSCDISSVPRSIEKTGS
ncbi:hypothetical protein L2E82_26988 [Cichorium intybus]|uniref:Uncharacterized protein n=1 Tax=Cichorium intybus TaxID=13427 RepID=A0ACB9CRV4_CICIN|nr:hypothetical protein L2E82_26988 [Cichorium intybus]